MSGAVLRDCVWLGRTFGTRNVKRLVGKASKVRRATRKKMFGQKNFLVPASTKTGETNNFVCAWVGGKSTGNKIIRKVISMTTAAAMSKYLFAAHPELCVSDAR